MDSLIYGCIALVLFASAWGQWYYACGYVVSAAVWMASFGLVFLLVRMLSEWAKCSEYLRLAWIEFGKVHWADVGESRALTVTVSLMIAVLSVMLWLMDQTAVWFLTRWV